MRRALFFIVAVFLATSSFASIPRAPACDASSSLRDSLPETRIRVFDVLAPFERPVPSPLNRALHQAYLAASTTNASGLGRFLSVDPVLDVKSNLGNPQGWNRYSYVRNNPMRFTDPSGRYLCDGGRGDCGVIRQALADVSAAMNNLSARSTGRASLQNVLNFYGKEGVDNGVTVRVGAALGVGGTSTEGNRTTVSIDLGAEAQQTGGRATALFRPEVASTIAHEGRHGIDQRRDGMPTARGMEKATELRAAKTEAYVWQGLRVDALWGTWTRAGGFDPAAIEREAETSTQIWCGAAGICH